MGVSVAWTVVVFYSKGQIWKDTKGHWNWGQNSPTRIRPRVNVYRLISLTTVEVAKEGTNSQGKLRNAFVTYSLTCFTLACYLLLPSWCKSNGNCRSKRSQKRKWKVVKSLLKQEQILDMTQIILSWKWQDRWARNHSSVITKLQCCNRHQHKMGATNVNVQLLAAAMCITRCGISLPTLLHDSEYHDSSRQIQNMEEAFVPTASSLWGENRF